MVELLIVVVLCFISWVVRSVFGYVFGEVIGIIEKVGNKKLNYCDVYLFFKEVFFLEMVMVLFLKFNLI